MKPIIGLAVGFIFGATCKDVLPPSELNWPQFWLVLFMILVTSGVIYRFVEIIIDTIEGKSRA